MARILPAPRESDQNQDGNPLRVRLKGRWYKTLGEKAYGDLVYLFPKHLGIKTSHVDAVLYRHEYEESARILASYGLSHESEWVEWQWGRTYLGLDKYDNAISYLNKVVNSRDPDSHYYIYLARALDFAGDAPEALKVLVAGKTRFQNDIGINSAFGFELMRLDRQDESKELLQPLFNEYNDNVYAAFALVKIFLDGSAIADAKEIVRKAENSAPQTLRNMVISMRADIEIAENQTEVALARLNKVSEPDPFICLSMLDALRKSAIGQPSGSIAVHNAMKFKVPKRYQYNARIQVAQARLALTLKDRSSWDRALANLSESRLDPAHLNQLRSDTKTL